MLSECCSQESLVVLANSVIVFNVFGLWQHKQSRGNRYALNIRNVTVADLGNYTCQASNQLGKDREALTVSGIPSICEIVESVS